MLKTIATGLNIFLLIHLVAGCGHKQKASSEAGSREIRYKSMLGEVFYGEQHGVDLTGLPKKLIYPDSRPSSRRGKYIPRWGCSYHLKTTDPPEQVLSYYEKLLSKWKLMTVANEENFKSRSYVSAGKKEVVEVNVTRKNDTTLIILCHTYRIMTGF
ncbi:MAG: hypothetical protein ACUVUR_06965 [bacterium]